MEEARALAKHIRSVVTEEDMSDAFDCGEEEMGTYTMTCVGYDAGFLNTLVRNAHNYVEERKTSENREKRVTKNGKENTSKRRKPKNIEPESDGDHASSLVLSAEEEYADDKPPDDTQSRSSGRPARSKRRRMT